MTAPIIRAIDQQAANAHFAHLRKGDLCRALGSDVVVAAGEGGHRRSFVRLACFRDAGSALQDSRLLNHARKVRDGLFVDGRRLWPSRPPGDLRQVSTGQDRAEAGCHGLMKRR